MKTFFATIAVVLISAFLVSGFMILNNNPNSNSMTPIQDFNDYTEDWEKVENLNNKGLPQSAMEIVDEIYAKATKDHNTPQIVKAIIYKLSLKSQFEENFLKSAIQDVQAEIKNAGFPENALLNSVLASLYWEFYENNRYKFLDRSATTTILSDDIETWDLNKILGHTIFHYMASLKNKQGLQQINLSGYHAILIENENSKLYRPTLYDFLAHRAIDFFINDESSITQPVYQFDMNQPGYLANANDFVDMKVVTKDTLSLKYHAVLIFQELLSFHLNDQDPTAFVDADLKRLGFAYSNMNSVENRDKLYEVTLNELLEKYSGYPVSTDISYTLARLAEQLGNSYLPLVSDDYRWEKKKAVEICDQAITKYPDSKGAKNCLALRDEITSGILSLTVENVIVPYEPVLGLLSYRNADRAYFRVVKTNAFKYNELKRDNRDEYLINIYRNLKPVHQWVIDINNENDYQKHSAQIGLNNYEPGFYVLLASSDETFNTKEGIVAISTFYSSKISFINNKTWEGNQEFYILDRKTGHPLTDVKAVVYLHKYDYNKRSYVNQKVNEYLSNNDGYIMMPYSNIKNESFYVELISGTDTLFMDGYYHSYFYPRDDTKHTSTYFFTDRAIYRPGQNIYFKGIVLEKYKGKYKILPKHKTTVTFYDVNGQEISSLDLTSNEYGSINGVFTAPSGVLNGEMRIQSESGSKYFSVEDYKRPKFEVVFNPVKGSYKLDEQVNITGSAASYSGAVIDNANVSYRVVRKVRFPYWGWWWRGYFPQPEEMEIANGSALTNNKGDFQFYFKAIPDLSVNKKFSPVFDFEITANVTDINGETHSATTTLSVGYNSLIAEIDIPGKLNRDEVKNFKVRTANMGGEFEQANVSVEIYKLKQPDIMFRERYWEEPDVFIMDEKEFKRLFPNDIYKNENEPQTWPVEKLVFKSEFITQENSMTELPDIGTWKDGVYKASLRTSDRYGEAVETDKYFTLFSEKSDKVPTTDVNWFTILVNSAEPGQQVSFLFGTAAKHLFCIYEVLHHDTVVNREISQLKNSLELKKIEVKEKYRGNFGINIAFVYNNRFYQNTQTFTIPYTNKELILEFATFRDKLQPGQKEEWQIKITGKDGDKAAAEMLAGMYDASLDIFRENNWIFNLYSSNSIRPSWNMGYCFGALNSRFYDKQGEYHQYFTQTYDQLDWFGMYFGSYPFFGQRMSKNAIMMEAQETEGAPSPVSNPENNGVVEKSPGADDEIDGNESAIQNELPEKQGQMAQPVNIRSDFRETAFFYPNLKTNDQGEVIISFTMPDALTRWKMMGLAYTKDLKIGSTIKELATQKELMVVPNAPRFFREGDQMKFSVKISSLSETTLNGSAELHFFNTLTMKPIDDVLGLKDATLDFSVAKGASTSLIWDIAIPEDIQAITYRIVARAGNFSDGEEMALPVLPNRMLVTESMPMWVKGEELRKYKFEKLINARESRTLSSFKLTLEFSSNPAWYAVQALPYLIEYPYECSEQVFSRYYANSLATFIANSDPKIKRVFESWQNLTPDALLSNLEKNQDLKYILLEETPWVRDAKNETERKRRLAVLFDMNRMSGELKNAMLKLQQLQAPNGGWPWFEGMRDDRYITQHIVTGFAHLRNLGVIDPENEPEVKKMLVKAISYLDECIAEDYERLKEQDNIDMKNDHIGYTQIQYLYARSYFTDLSGVNKKNTTAFSYYRDQADTYWLNKSIYMQGMISLALNRYGYKTTPSDIIRSLKEKSLFSEEMGRYWRSENGWYWYQAPVEQQALLIEAFDEVAGDEKSVEEMKIWLLKQKQTQNWETTKATVDAIYALLLRGTDLLASDELVEITLGSLKVEPYQRDEAQVEAGTGYFQASWWGSDIKPDMGNVQLVKKDKGIAWGALYWQYYEDLDKITPHKTPLSLERRLFIEKNTNSGPVIEEVSEGNTLKIGDKVIVRIILRSDRDMEYIHLKDMRAASFEPVNVLSGYRYQGGLGYYESTRDASTNFFIDYLAKGTYVFEYPLIVSQQGEFSNGISTIQCMYAPEFSSHSEGVRVVVK